MFCLSSWEMLALSPALTASPIKDVQDWQWMPPFISHTHLHVVLSLWNFFHHYRGLKIRKIWIKFLKRMYKIEKMKNTCASKIIPIQCSKKLLKMKNSKSFLYPPSSIYFFHFYWYRVVLFHFRVNITSVFMIDCIYFVWFLKFQIITIDHKLNVPFSGFSLMIWSEIIPQNSILVGLRAAFNNYMSLS